VTLTRGTPCINSEDYQPVSCGCNGTAFQGSNATTTHFLFLANNNGLDGLSFESRLWKYNLFDPKPFTLPLRATQPSIQWVPGFFPRGKGPGREDNNAEDENN
jgi:hypothetical protein